MKITLLSLILSVMLIGTVLSNTLVGTSYASLTPDPRRAPPWEGARPPHCSPDTPAFCQNATAVPNTGIAMAQQIDNVLAALTIGKDGAMYVTFKTGVGKWNTVGISPKGIFPPGANIAMAKQTNDILAALAVGNDGAMYVSWVAGVGVWNKQASSTGPAPYPPVPITPKGYFHPGADIAMVKQTNDRLTAWAVGRDGALYQSWVDGGGVWNKPVSPPAQGQPEPTYPFKPLLICCKGVFPPEQASIAMHKEQRDMLTALIVERTGTLMVVQIDAPCNVDGCREPSNRVPQEDAYSLNIYPGKLFPVGADIGIAQEQLNKVTALVIGIDGAMYMTYAVDAAHWATPVGISPPNMFPPGASVSIAKQSNDVLTAVAVGNDGALYVSWTAPGGWNKPSNAKGPGPYSPVAISPKGLFPPGAGIAMVNFNGVLEALTAGKDGSIYVSWVVGMGKWNGPVRIY